MKLSVRLTLGAALHRGDHQVDAVNGIAQRLETLEICAEIDGDTLVVDDLGTLPTSAHGDRKSDGTNPVVVPEGGSAIKEDDGRIAVVGNGRQRGSFRNSIGHENSFQETRLSDGPSQGSRTVDSGLPRVLNDPEAV